MSIEEGSSISMPMEPTPRGDSRSALKGTFSNIDTSLFSMLLVKGFSSTLGSICFALIELRQGDTHTQMMAPSNTIGLS